MIENTQEVFMDERYSRQVIFDKIGAKGQEKIRKSSITLVGIGALGSVAAELLCRAGIGKLVLIDRDFIEESNLHRQNLFLERDIGKFKSEVAAKRLKLINSKTKIDFFVTDLNHRNINELLKEGLILDCTDNIYTRHLINEYCLKNKKSWIYSAAIRDYGNVMPIFPEWACFRCVFGNAKANDTCDTSGIINTITNTISSISVTIALKLILNIKINQELIRYDIWNNHLSKIRVKKNNDCAACKGNYEFLSGKNEAHFTKYCGNNNFQFFLENLEFNKIKKKLEKISNTKQTQYCLFFKNMIIFRDGRVLIRDKGYERAKSLIAKYIGI